MCAQVFSLLSIFACQTGDGLAPESELAAWGGLLPDLYWSEDYGQVRPPEYIIYYTSFMQDSYQGFFCILDTVESLCLDGCPQTYFFNSPTVAKILFSFPDGWAQIFNQSTVL
jgi:hypothetical protein